MKNGYRLVYHKSISGEDKRNAEEFLLDFIEKVNKEGSYAKAFRTHGGWNSCLRWKSFGLPVSDFKNQNYYCVSEKLILRRLSKNRRIFGVVPRDLVFSLNGYACSTQYKRCICPKCTMAWTSGKGFGMGEPYKDSDYITFYESGEIKG